MSLTPSTMLPLGTPMPEIDLPDVTSGRRWRSAELPAQQVLVVMFICNHCPYVVHVQPELVRLGKDYRDHAVQLVAICSNDAERYPDDDPEAMREQARRLGYAFPYLHDASQDAARAFRAACTPDFYVFDRDGRCAYRGQLDGSRPGNELPLDGADLRRAIEACCDGRAPDPEQVPSVGCNIKWRA